ncbi:MAG: ATP-binding cassette domain-containing protein [Actinomycetales bacterium]|nr:ATP-binding cassette domain-containing protein [Actinomycetales bacterium]
MAYSQPGVFKQAWVSQLFGQAAGTGSGPCGRFTAELCAVYTDLVAGRPLSGDARALLAASSPAAVLNRMSAPTLLLQGTQDTLFGLDHADANARQIAAAGAPVQVVWFAGGHDGAAGVDAFTATEETVTDWLATYLPVDGLPGPEVGTAGDPLPFTYPVPASSGRFAGDVEAAAYPGLVPSGDGVATTTVQVTGLPTPVANPPGGLPAAITSLPGLEALGGTGLGLDVPRPGQFALFVSEPLPESLTLVGSAEVRVQVARAPGGQFPEAGAATDAVLFVALFDVDDAGRTLPGATVAPVRVDDLPTDGTPVDVTVVLPATVWEFDAGHRVAVQVATTDALYQPSPAAAQYVVDASGAVTMPLVPGTARTTGGAASPAVLAGIAGVLLAGLVLLAVIRLRSRTSVRAAVGALPGTASPAPGEAPPDDTGASASPAPAGRTAAPLVLTGLTKVYPRGLQAVDDLSFTVEHGQVLGLLGPNGAGKTTALRMAVGLLRPSAGSVRIFGEEVRPGADVLTRVGCFIEGPGFLPHLSGLRNLELYWAASGREPAAARIDEALTIAGLGEAVHRRVRGYSQGMRQRLAIAQAMLGMPELLILDEPTNGLDPPQIHDMRGVLARYAASGRTVVVSSHQLAEVERTCTHVVVMAAGRLVAAGTVAELAGESGEVTLEVSDASAAQAVLVALGIAEVMTLSATSVRVEPDGVPTESMVSALVVAGVGVRAVVHGRHLEETFLELVSE